MADYEFVTVWRVNAPLEAVWEMIYHSDQWPSWWKGVERVEKVSDGGENHVGSVRRYTWKSTLPSRLVVQRELTRVEPMSTIEGRAFGELEGRGLWTLSEERGVTTARYDWRVRTTKPWMNLLAPVAR